MAFIVDDLLAWLVGWLADSGRRHLTTFVVGNDQRRELRSVAMEAVRLTARELSSNDEQADGVAAAIIGVFSATQQSLMQSEGETMLEALQAGVAQRLEPLGDPSLTGTGESWAEVMDVTVETLAERLNGHLIREIVTRGAEGGPLTPLAAQINSDVSHLQGTRLEGMLGQLAHEVRTVLTSLTDAHAVSASRDAGKEKAEHKVWTSRVPAVPILFIGREALVKNLRSELSDGQTTVLTQTIQGMGGVGKTSIAAALAEICRHELDIVWWVRAERLDVLVDDVAELGTALGLPRKSQRSSEIAASVRDWLEVTPRSWLIVFDNAADESSIESYLPKRGNGSVIVTSRNRNMNRIGNVIEVNVFSESVAQKFLRERVSARNPGAATEDLTAVLERLGGLPLALEQAAAWVERAPYRRFAQYIDLFDNASREPFPDGTSPHGYDHTATTAWRISIEAATREAPCAGRLLSVIAFLGPDDIGCDLLRVLASAGEPFLNSTAAGVDDALTALFGYSLVQLTDSDKVGVHRVIQSAVQKDSPPNAFVSAIAVLRMMSPCESSPHDVISDELYTETPSVSALKLVDASTRYLNSLESAFSELARDLSNLFKVFPDAFASDDSAYTDEGVALQRQVLFAQLRDGINPLERLFIDVSARYLVDLQTLAPSLVPNSKIDAILFYRKAYRIVYLALAVLNFWILIGMTDDAGDRERFIGSNPALRDGQREVEGHLKRICVNLNVHTTTKDSRVIVTVSSTDTSASVFIRSPLYPRFDPIHLSAEKISVVLKADIPPRLS